MMYLASLAEETRDKVDGYKFIHTKVELDKVVTDNLHSNKVVIRQDFASEFFTPTGLARYIENVRRINVNIVIELDGTEESLTRDRMIDKISMCRDSNELLDLMIMHSSEFMDVLNSLIRRRNNDYKQMLIYSNQVSRLQSSVEELKGELENQKYMTEQESRNKLAFQSKLDALISRINFTYNKNIDANKQFTVRDNSYDKILYIKEYSRVQYVDTLIYYLQEILKTIYHMPTRQVVIENYYADAKISMYPNLVPHHNLIERDVIKGDILMLGMQPKLMEDILKNASNISILIILDRGGYGVPHVVGDNVETLYCFSDIKDKPDNIPLKRCISYEDNTLNIPYIENYNDLDASDRIGTYSSLDIVKKIVKLIEKK